MSEDPSLAYRRQSEARRAALGLAPLPMHLIPRIAVEDLRLRHTDILTTVRTVWAGEGWRDIVDDALEVLRGQPVTVGVIREHCAGLQMLIGPRGAWTDSAFELVSAVHHEARARSVVTCEACGRPGRPRIPGPGVRCDEHVDWR